MADCLSVFQEEPDRTARRMQADSLPVGERPCSYWTATPWPVWVEPLLLTCFPASAVAPDLLPRFGGGACTRRVICCHTAVCSSAHLNVVAGRLGLEDSLRHLQLRRASRCSTCEIFYLGVDLLLVARFGGRACTSGVNCCHSAVCASGHLNVVVGRLGDVTPGNNLI